MSHNIRLVQSDGSTAQVVPHTEGGTYVLGGTTDAEMTVTYNYSPFYYDTLDDDLGLRWLNGKQAGDTINRMLAAIGMLGCTRDKDYWARTPGNAGYALSILVKWADEYPDAHWEMG